MLRPDEILIGLECEPVEFADPERRAAIKEVGHQLETAGLLPRNLVYARNGAVMASVSSLGPYLLPAAQIVVPTLGAILVAWVKMPRRKVRVKIGDTLIEATSVEEVEQLLPQIRELHGKDRRKKPAA